MLEAGQAMQVRDITRKVLLSQVSINFEDFEVLKPLSKGAYGEARIYRVNYL